jgi:hypothetical protein
MAEFDPEHLGVEGLDAILSDLSKRLVNGNGNREERLAKIALRRQKTKRVNEAFGNAMLETNHDLVNFSIPYLVLGGLNLAEEMTNNLRMIYDATRSSPIIQKKVRSLIEQKIRRMGFQFKEYKVKVSLTQIGVKPEDVIDRFNKEGMSGIFLYAIDLLDAYVKKNHIGNYEFKEKIAEMRESHKEMAALHKKGEQLAHEIVAYAGKNELSIDAVVGSLDHLIPVVRKTYGTLEEFYLVREQQIEAMRTLGEKLAKLGGVDVTKELNIAIARKYAQKIDDLGLKDGEAIERVIEIPGSYVHDFMVFGRAFLKNLIVLEEQELDRYRRKGGFL